MKLGIIGTGKIVQEFLPWLAQFSGTELCAICSTPRSESLAEKLCEQYGIPQHFINFNAMLEVVDTVYIAVPNAQHVLYIRMALNAGRNVIVEKPMTATAAEAEEMAALAREKGVFLFEAVTTQYLENYAKIRELLPRVGTVKLVQCNYSQYSSRYDAFCAGQVLPAFDPACAGGALMDLNLYNVSYVVGLFGEPKKVNYAANIERDIDTSGVLTLDYEGFKAVCIAAKDCAAPTRYVIQGTKGYILQKTSANICGALTFHANDGSEEHFNLNGKRPREAAEFETFARAINAGDQDLCNRMLDTSLAVSRVLTAARKSAGIVFPADNKAKTGQKK
jgi:predicted dehydrogenase